MSHFFFLEENKSSSKTFAKIKLRERFDKFYIAKSYFIFEIDKLA